MGKRGKVLRVMNGGNTESDDMYSGSERSGELQVRVKPSQPASSKSLDLGEK